MDACVHPSVADFVQAMDTLIQERHKHSENCILFELSPRATQKFWIHPVIERSDLAFLSKDLEQFFWQ